MTFNPLEEKGIPLDDQTRNWRELNVEPYRKDQVHPYSRTRGILMNGIEVEAVLFSHQMHRNTLDSDVRKQLAQMRRIEQEQQKVINWLIPGEESTIEVTLGYEQLATDLTAWLARHEPDPYLKQVYDFALLEDFDHLYRYSALMDRIEGRDANNIVQSYTDVIPGRPTSLEHRHPLDDLRAHYDKDCAAFITKLHALTITAAEFQTHDYYMNIGPTFADPIARQLYAEIASIEEQHVTQYESLADPNETPLEKWLLHEANEVYNYWSCVESEQNPEIKAIWERFLDYELGQLQHVAELFARYERRDPAEVIPVRLPTPVRYVSHRDFVKRVLRNEQELSARGPLFVPREQEFARTRIYREQLNSEGSPSDAIAADYRWQPGTELTAVPAAQVDMPQTLADEDEKIRRVQ